MKAPVALILFLAVVISCKKENNFNKDFVGNWKLAYSLGGIVGRSNVTADNVNILLLNADNTFVNTINNKIINQGSYTITNKASGSYSGTAIVYNNSDSNWQFIAVKNDSLSITINYTVGLASVYSRQK
jgi:hypothetical protein